MHLVRVASGGPATDQSLRTRGPSTASATEEPPERCGCPRYAKPTDASTPSSSRVAAAQPDMPVVKGFSSRELKEPAGSSVAQGGLHREVG